MSSEGSSSPPRRGNPAGGSKEDRPRFFGTTAKSKCWANAQVVLGRHPERWRKDAAGNIVCKRFCNCQGCLCFEYDHIIPYSKVAPTPILKTSVVPTAYYERLKDNNGLSLYELVDEPKAFTNDEAQENAHQPLHSLPLLQNFPPLSALVGGESVAENCQILQTRVNRFKSDKEAVGTDQLQQYACDIKFSDKELDIIEMAVYGDVIRPGNECRCRTVAEMLGKLKSKDRTAACKLPTSDGPHT
ncbi:hypothetical protein AgCh_015901 [Apium graveolens]